MCLHRSPTTFTLWPVASNALRLDDSYRIKSEKYHTGEQGVKRKKRKYAAEYCLPISSSDSGFHNGHPGKWYKPLILYSMLVILHMLIRYCSSIINLGLKFTLITISDCEMPNIFLRF